ncbi:MAG: ribonuclease III [Christensenellales bacterium]
MINLENLQNLIGYKFKDISLLEMSLTHQSYANDNNVHSYERLEFLGDAVIELIVSDYIYHLSDFDAGVSTKLRASLVSTEYLFNVSNKLELPSLVLKSKSLQQLGKKNTADLFESLIGAVYLDGGLSYAKDIINKFVIISKENVRLVMRTCVDYKSKFQELMQAKGNTFEYKLLSSSGLDHEKIFEVGLFINDQNVATARASSIHSAEEKCAEIYLNSNPI